MTGIGDLFWLFFIFTAVQPALQRRMLESARIRLMQRIERKYNVRIITLIHRQETMSFLGFPLMKYIDMHDSEAVMRAIRLTDKDTPIDLVLHTPGGLALAATQIARALRKHSAKTRVIVPHYAMSGGTLIALAADEIVMDENAVLGPIDPQLGQHPAASVLKVLDQKSLDHVDDETLIEADLARKAIAQLEALVTELLRGRMPPEQAKSVAETLASGKWTHDYPITAEAAQELGLKVSCDMPEEYYHLMNLYPQPLRQSATVQYLPEPVRKRVDEAAQRPKQG